MSHIKLLLLLASLSCLNLHCKKESELDKLPPATTTGKQTFGCLINGKAWPIGVKGSHLWVVNYQNRQIDVGYYIKDSPFAFTDKEWVSITLKKVNKPGYYLVSLDGVSECSISIGSINDSYFSSDNVNKNAYASILITRLDSINHFLSGTFEFSLFNESGTSQVKVSSGRFDFNYP
ncbi:MAG: hypothetical protein K1X81_07810 [Bacteroidia bacterium]|nr:hypothetical protein [Bacteroidia bacterium]